MFSNGNVTVYVSDMDAAIRFFTNALGLTLTNRFGRQWATIHAGPSYWTTDEAGAGLIIGLHPRSSKAPAPGTVGSIGFGVETYEPLVTVIPKLTKRGVRVTSEIISFEAGNSVGFEDADGHASFVHEFPPFMLQESDLQEPPAAASSAPAAMLSGGLAIVYVSSMDQAVRFYSETLGLNLTNRYGDQLRDGGGRRPRDRVASANREHAEARHEGLDRARPRRRRPGRPRRVATRRTRRARSREASIDPRCAATWR